MLKINQTRVTLSNDFHNTKATLILKPIKSGRFAGKFSISAESAKRARKKLCPRRDCSCSGNEFKSRGGAYLFVDNRDYDNNFIIDLSISHI